MKQPSVRQIQAFHYINQGMSKRAAMIKAGYSPSTANQAMRVIHTQSMKAVTQSFADQLENEGLTTQYLAWKLKELVDATKFVDGVIVPDYKTQIEAMHQCIEILKNLENKRKPMS